MKRVGFVVDGLNLYHSIERYPCWHGFKWLNLRALANAFIKPSQEVVQSVSFCTSSPTWNINKLHRHTLLLRVYEDLGIKIVKGEIRETKKWCRGECRQQFKTHEEKQTDINVAIEVVRLGMSPDCDKVFLVTGDSDQIPTVEFFRATFPTKELVVVIPYGELSANLRSTASQSTQITIQQLKRSLIENPYTLKDGSTIERPDTWVHGQQAAV